MLPNPALPKQISELLYNGRGMVNDASINIEPYRTNAASRQRRIGERAPRTRRM